jgi:sugar phosphate isomerase/epimerase
MDKTCIFAWFGYILPMEEKLKLIKNAGFDSVMLWWGDEFKEIDGDKNTHIELVNKHNLFVENIHTPFDGINAIWEKGGKGDEFNNMLLTSIHDCALYHIPTIVVHISQGFNPPPVNKIGIDRIIKLVETAEKYNINLALENIERSDYLEEIYSDIKSDRLGFCYDSGHANCFSEGSDLLDKFGSKLMALHLHDNDGVCDLHNLPGDGNIDWKTIMSKIKGNNYHGALSLEANRPYPPIDPLESPQEYLKKAFDAAQKLLSL